MGNKYFTEEQIKSLNNNKYVIKASSKSITYTKEFKEACWEKYQKAIPYKEIVSSLGLNPEVLGKARVNSIFGSLKVKYYRSAGFEDTRTIKSGRKSKETLDKEQNESYKDSRIQELEQEIEFLKKNVFLEQNTYISHKRHSKKNAK
jgi:hypothetical protein